MAHRLFLKRGPSHTINRVSVDYRAERARRQRATASDNVHSGVIIIARAILMNSSFRSIAATRQPVAMAQVGYHRAFMARTRRWATTAQHPLRIATSRSSHVAI